MHAKQLPCVCASHGASAPGARATFRAVVRCDPVTSVRVLCLLCGWAHSWAEAERGKLWWGGLRGRMDVRARQAVVGRSPRKDGRRPAPAVLV